MLVERTFSIEKNANGDRNICSFCPINEVCLRFVDRQSGDVITERVDSFSTQSFDYRSNDFIKKTSKQASICRKSFPKYKIVETTPKEIHRIVGRGGNTIVESDSWLGMIGQYFLVAIGVVVIIAIIGAVFCGIAELFN